MRQFHFFSLLKATFWRSLGIRSDLLCSVRGLFTAVGVQEVVPLWRHVHCHFIAGGISERAAGDLLHNRSVSVLNVLVFVVLTIAVILLHIDLLTL